MGSMSEDRFVASTPTAKEMPSAFISGSQDNAPTIESPSAETVGQGLDPNRTPVYSYDPTAMDAAGARGANLGGGFPGDVAPEQPAKTAPTQQPDNLPTGFTSLSPLMLLAGALLVIYLVTR
jgi:hypothetical protein